MENTMRGNFFCDDGLDCEDCWNDCLPCRDSREGGRNDQRSQKSKKQPPFSLSLSVANLM